MTLTRDTDTFVSVEDQRRETQPAGRPPARPGRSSAGTGQAHRENAPRAVRGNPVPVGADRGVASNEKPQRTPGTSGTSMSWSWRTGPSS